MNILKFDDFINESKIAVNKIVKDVVDLTNIKVKCVWNGEHWYYFDRENKGTYDDFIKLDKNKNATLELYFDFDFNISAGDNEGHNVYTIKALTKLHYNDMSLNDYDIDFTYCKNIDTFVEHLSIYENISLENMNNLFETSWNEYDVDYDIKDALEDYIGIKENDIIEKIKQLTLENVVNECYNMIK